MKVRRNYGMTIIGVLLFLGICIFIPPIISKYRDRKIIEKIDTKRVSESNAGYRYQLSDLERVLVFSKARENLSASKRYNSLSLSMEYARVERASTYSGSVDSHFILFINQKGSGSDEYSEEEIKDICRQEVDRLTALSILPALQLDFSSGEGKLFTIVNAADPAMNISVWELSGGQSGQSGYWQFEVDAQTGRIYDFNVSLLEPLLWEDLDIDTIVENFSDYLGLPKPSRFLQNDMMERTPYYQKYIVELEEEMMFTIGLDPGNNSFFIRIP